MGYDWHTDLVADITRTILIIGWSVTALQFWFAGRKGCDEARPLRRYASFVSAYWVVFYTWFMVAVHTGWSLDWHNELSRIGTYFTLSVLLVWSSMALKRCRDRDRNGVS